MSTQFDEVVWINSECYIDLLPSKDTQDHIFLTSINRPGALNLKIELSDVYLPEGSYIEVASKDRKEIHFASFNATNKYVVETQTDTVSIKVVLPEECYDLTCFNAILSKIEFIPTPSGLIGDDDRLPLAYFRGSAIFNFSNAVAAVKLGVRGSGSLIGNGNFLLTNQHVIVDPDVLRNGELWLNWFYPNPNDFTQQPNPVVIEAGQLLTMGTGGSLGDYALITMDEFDYRNAEVKRSFGGLALSYINPNVKDPIYIPQHGGGYLIPMVVGDRFETDYSRITSLNPLGATTYNADTEPGSSGSPVLSRADNRIVALHFATGTGINYGVPLTVLRERLLPYISADNIGVVAAGNVTGSSCETSPFLTGVVDINLGADLHIETVIDNIPMRHETYASFAQIEEKDISTGVITRTQFRLSITVPGLPYPVNLTNPRGVGQVRLNIERIYLPSDNAYAIRRCWLPLELKNNSNSIVVKQIIRVNNHVFDPFYIPFNSDTAVRWNIGITGGVAQSFTFQLTGHQYGYVALHLGQGPQALVWDSEGYSVINTLLRRTGYPGLGLFVLRGNRLTDCTRRPMNDATGCESGLHSSLAIEYQPQDNAGIPDSGYYCYIPLQAQVWGDNNHTYTQNILLTVTIL